MTSKEERESKPVPVDDILNMMEKEVDELFRMRDEFFVTHTDASDKSRVMEEALRQCRCKLDELEAQIDLTSINKSQKAQLYYHRGRALNSSSSFCSSSEEFLSKAAKLEPMYYKAWNELGELYWKDNQSTTAQMCFTEAVQKSDQKDKKSLRNLSIVLRASHSNDDRANRIEEGLLKAKEAVQLDMKDGISWSILGNAYLAHFFSVAQNPRTLKQAMTAYKNAQRDPIADTTAELHYNKAIALKYEEEYASALESFGKAVLYDPNWDEPRDQMRSLSRFIADIYAMIGSKGKLRMKRLSNLMDKLQVSCDKIQKMDEDKPGENGLPLVAFSKLTEGSNRGNRILGTVIGSVHSTDSVPFTFCMIDVGGDCLAVNVYNLSPGKGVVIGDQVGVVEPEVRHVEVEREGGTSKSCSFKLVRIDSPMSLVINGKRPSQEIQAGIQLSTFTKSD